MTVYADILVLVNTYVNFFVLLATCALLRHNVSFYRMLFGSFAGGLGALIILLPQQNEVLTAISNLLLATLISVITFGFGRPRIVIKRIAFFFGSSFVFSGCIYCVWLAFKPARLIINNSVIYFDISALELIVASAVIYGLIIIVRTLNGGFCKNERRTVELSICHNGENVTYKCLLDTGNMLRDAFSDMPVAVVDGRLSDRLGINFSSLDEGAIRDNKIRFIPFNTVGNEGLMPVFKPSSVKIDGKEKNGVLIGVSDRHFDGEYNAVANYDIV